MKPKIETFFCGHCEERKGYIKDFSFLYWVADEKITVCKGCSPGPIKKTENEIDINEQLLF